MAQSRDLVPAPRSLFHVSLSLKRTKCAICGIELWGREVIPPRVCMRPCALAFTPEAEIKEMEAMELMTQCNSVLGKVPSQTPVPSWAEIVERPEFANSSQFGPNLAPRALSLLNLDRPLAHLCAVMCNPEALRAVLRKWPDSTRALSQVRFPFKGVSQAFWSFQDKNTPLLELIGAGCRTDDVSLRPPIPTLIQCVRILAEYKADVNASVRGVTCTCINVFQNVKGRTPLMLAVRGGVGVELVQLVIDLKANVNAKAAAGRTAVACSCAGLSDGYTGGFTALHEALLAENIEAIRPLIAAGARLRFSVRGESPLDIAVGMRGGTSPVDAKALRAVKALSEAKNFLKHLNPKPDKDYCFTPFQAAARVGRPRTLQFLIECKADIHRNVTPGTGYAALAIAVSEGHLECCKLLVAAGACTQPVIATTVKGDHLLCTLTQLYNKPQLNTPEERAFVQWLKEIETPRLLQCKKCGMDASPAGIEKIASHQAKEDESLARDQRGETQPACSNPACQGLKLMRDAYGKTVQPRLKKCSRCQQVAYCEYA